MDRRTGPARPKNRDFNLTNYTPNDSDSDIEDQLLWNDSEDDYIPAGDDESSSKEEYDYEQRQTYVANVIVSPQRWPEERISLPSLLDLLSPQQDENEDQACQPATQGFTLNWTTTCQLKEIHFTNVFFRNTDGVDAIDYFDDFSLKMFNNEMFREKCVCRKAIFVRPRKKILENH